MNMHVQYVGSLRTEARHQKSGVQIFTDAPPDNQGKGESFSPTDLMSTSLAACQMTIMGILAKREGIMLDGLKADVVKIMSADLPRRVVEIQVNYTTTESLKALPQEQKAKLIQAAKTCPVALSIHPDIKQNVTFDF